MGKMSDRAARLVSLYFDGDTDKARNLVNGVLGLAIAGLIEQSGGGIPAETPALLNATNLEGDELEFPAAAAPSSGKQPPAPPSRWDD